MKNVQFILPAGLEFTQIFLVLLREFCYAETNSLTRFGINFVSFEALEILRVYSKHQFPMESMRTPTFGKIVAMGDTASQNTSYTLTLQILFVVLTLIYHFSEQVGTFSNKTLIFFPLKYVSITKEHLLGGMPTSKIIKLYNLKIRWDRNLKEYHCITLLVPQYFWQM